eukprot:SAG11_NODE_25450_length_358_cov_1.393822_1_plen_48_part_10
MVEGEEKSRAAVWPVQHPARLTRVLLQRETAGRCCTGWRQRPIAAAAA